MDIFDFIRFMLCECCGTNLGLFQSSPKEGSFFDKVIQKESDELIPPGNKTQVTYTFAIDDDSSSDYSNDPELSQPNENIILDKIEINIDITDSDEKSEWNSPVFSATSNESELIHISAASDDIFSPTTPTSFISSESWEVMDNILSPLKNKIDNDIKYI